MNRTGSITCAPFRLPFRNAMEDDSQFQIKQAKDQYGDALGIVKMLDPNGWEYWYEACVPDWSGHWLNSKPAFDVIYKRACELLFVRLIVHTPTLHPLLEAVTNS